MRPTVEARNTEAHGSLNSAVFGISTKDQAHILNILRDRLYSNKVLAVLREYGSNAWDAHRDAGKPDLPIKVVLPTVIEPSLVIRDYGTGLSEEDIFEVYVKYGASTKRDTNEAVGMLGIGAKSAFAYSDSFTITSWHGGEKAIYTAYLDESDLGIVSLLHKEPCEDGETGIEIKVPVNPDDVSDFQREAKFLYPFFSPQPAINMELEKPIDDKWECGFLRKNRIYTLPNWVAVMGCVPYRLSFEQVKDQLAELGLDQLPERLFGGLFFNIGEVDISASREDLEYTQRTKDAILQRLKELNIEVAKGLTETIEGAESGWERRLSVKGFQNKHGLAVPDEYKNLLSTSVALYESKVVTETDKDGNKFDVNHAPKTFRMGVLEATYYQRRNGEIKRLYPREHPIISVVPDTALYLVDTDKPLKGYFRKYEMYRYGTPRLRAITSRNGASISEVELELSLFLKRAQLDGIPIKRVSERTYTEQKSTRNKKHRQTYFRKLPESGMKASDGWEAVDREPSEDDVFVLLERFCAVGYGRFFYKVNEHREILKYLGVPFPTDIYGVKTTEKKPVKAEDVEGTEYADWFKKVFKEGLKANPDIRKLLETYYWSCLPLSLFNKKDFEKLETALGSTHPVVHLLFNYHRAQKRMSGQKKAKRQLREKLQSINRVLDSKDAEEIGLNVAATTLVAVLETYPLIDLHPNRLQALTRAGSHEGALKHWIHYIKLIDKESHAASADGTD